MHRTLKNLRLTLQKIDDDETLNVHGFPADISSTHLPKNRSSGDLFDLQLLQKYPSPSFRIGSSITIISIQWFEQK